MKRQLIRNFCIIAHIDHGKSTLADRLLQFTGTISQRQFRDQVLDDMDLERERGITIKASAVKFSYKASDGKTYLLNLIDTPGHVDFSYEVSKALTACEGALLLVDATQGVQAQTIANLYLALEHKLTIIPIINKIDLSNAEPEKVVRQIVSILNVKEEEEIILASAKEGIGTGEVLERVVRCIPPPTGEVTNPLQGLIFDSSFDIYKGVVIYLRVFNGLIQKQMQIKLMSNNQTYEVQEVGIFSPRMVNVDTLGAGEVGFITANIRNAKEINIGDTITSLKNSTSSALPGYKKIRPMVFSSIYPVNSKDFSALREAIEKLHLSDSSFIYEPETSASLGFGFRCGFLGLLHMEIVQERLEREYDLNLVVTTPTVIYRIKDKKGKIVEIDNPSRLPASNEIETMEEPYIQAFLIVPTEALGAIMELSTSRRGIYKSTEYISEDRAKLIYEFPLNEVIVDFYDRLKSITKGYGSLDYEFAGYMPTKLVKLDILLNGQVCDALSCIIYKEKAQSKGKLLVQKLKELIPKQLFEIAIQAAVGSQIISRETVRPLKKHVTGKCYGGDITRKRKLWEKQKEGKKKMKQIGKVQIPQEAFMAVLKI